MARAAGCVLRKCPKNFAEPCAPGFLRSHPVIQRVAKSVPLQRLRSIPWKKFGRNYALAIHSIRLSSHPRRSLLKKKSSRSFLSTKCRGKILPRRIIRLPARKFPTLSNLNPGHEVPRQNTSAENHPAARPKVSHSQQPESWPRNRFFPNRAASETEQEKSAPASSAFLKPSYEATVERPQSAVSASARFVPVTPAASVNPEAAPSPATHAAQPYAQARPYVPPLEESFEQAWERAKLSAPPESPRLSRAASGSIIAIALAVILGAIGYNFRQDIGSIFIQMGQSIAGDNRAAAPPPAAETKSSPTQPDGHLGTLPIGNQPDGQPSSQPAARNAAEKPNEGGPETQSAPAESARTAKPNSQEQTNPSQPDRSSQQTTNDGATTAPAGIAAGKEREFGFAV